MQSMQFLIRKFALAVLFVAILVGLIAFGRGYRFSTSQRSVGPTGILVASSNPDGAKIFVNGELKGATNSNIVLSPGSYHIEVQKDGFTSWSKDVTIKGELVLKADALLFPQNPTLSPVTSLGVTKAVSSPSGDKIIIVSETDNPEEDGLYMLENVRNPLSRINPLNMLILRSSFTQLPATTNLGSLTVEFSPDEKEALITIPSFPDTDTAQTTSDSGTQAGGVAALKPPTATPTPAPPTRADDHIYLISTDTLTDQPFDVTDSVETVRAAWMQEEEELRAKALKTFKKPLAQVAQESFDIRAFSPDETKILYTASQSATIPAILKKPLIASNQTPESRSIEAGKTYVYDAEEDRNYLIEGDASSMIWYPSSMHIVMRDASTANTQKIVVVDYDGTNRRTVYSGPFDPRFITCSKDGKLFILTNFNSETGSIYDIYSIGLK